jgi:crotonobetaine/carnitine-CoA ligase
MNVLPNESRVQMLQGSLRAARHLLQVEASEGTLAATLAKIAESRAPAFARDWSFGELLEWAAEKYRFQPFLDYAGDTFSFNDMNRRANRVAHHLLAAGVGPGTGLAIMAGNHPRFLDAFFAAQKAGAWAVPVNTALVGDGLAYILEHSDSSAVICDHECAPKIAALRERLPRIGTVWVNSAEAPADFVLPAGMRDFAELESGHSNDSENPGVAVQPAAPAVLMYTSGTTGLPKAVVSHYGQLRTKSIGLLANLLYRRDDKLYTCLPLFHANALMLSVMSALWVGIPLRLAKKFSASRFWQDVAESGATQFNTVGSMIPVLLKTPPSPWDRAHRVRRVISAACPRDAWQPFEQRYNLTIWEAYGAVDGAGITIFNSGNAPAGSLGKPSRNLRWKLVDGDGNDVPAGTPGELLAHVGSRSESKVHYWKNEKAASEKVVDGWLHTGDLMQRDARGFLYFVGRNTDSMRVRGENVSAYEIEKIVDGHPDVLESAAFGVPSPLGEQDAMIAVVPVDGHRIDAAGLLRYLRERLPKYAVPAWLDVVDELPKTGTHRVMKNDLKKRGVSAASIRLDDNLLNSAPARERDHA